AYRLPDQPLCRPARSCTYPLGVAALTIPGGEPLRQCVETLINACVRAWPAPVRPAESAWARARLTDVQQRRSPTVRRTRPLAGHWRHRLARPPGPGRARPARTPPIARRKPLRRRRFGTGPRIG